MWWHQFHSFVHHCRPPFSFLTVTLGVVWLLAFFVHLVVLVFLPGPTEFAALNTVLSSVFLTHLEWAVVALLAVVALAWVHWAVFWSLVVACNSSFYFNTFLYFLCKPLISFSCLWSWFGIVPSKPVILPEYFMFNSQSASGLQDLGNGWFPLWYSTLSGFVQSSKNVLPDHNQSNCWNKPWGLQSLLL